MLLRKCVTEFIGTFFLVMTIGMVVTGNKTDQPFVLAPVVIGSMLMVMVYMGGHISGAHYNPAVSTAVLLRGKMKLKEFVPYIVSQVIGAMAASFLVYAVAGSTFAPAPAIEVATVNGDLVRETKWLNAVLIEFIFTFALALVVLNVATATGTAGNSFYGVAIGFTVMAAAAAGGGISGGAFNPAVGIGPIFVHTMLGKGSLIHLWIYIVGPVLGAIVAAFVFAFQNESRISIDRT